MTCAFAYCGAPRVRSPEGEDVDGEAPGGTTCAFACSGAPRVLSPEGQDVEGEVPGDTTCVFACAGAPSGERWAGARLKGLPARLEPKWPEPPGCLAVKLNRCTHPTSHGAVLIVLYCIMLLQLPTILLSHSVPALRPFCWP